LLDISDEEWSSLFQLNVTHCFVVCRALLPAMIERGVGASIIMTASHTAWLAKPDLIAYNATKSAIIGLVRGLAEAVGKHDIRVNAVAPGWTMTERQLRQWATPAAIEHTVHQAQALPLMITPDELVGTYLFLASASSRPLTRQVLVADAGQSKH
jgi:NAD(P)-dependent dehydrogenase (short-subunit alcohol dehydrogenase family)